MKIFSQMKKAKIKKKDVSAVNKTKAPNLPKYSSGVINSASGYARATRPANVGMVSQEIQDFCNDQNYSGHTLDDWKKWHLKKHGNGKGIDRAVEEAWNKFIEIRNSLATVTKDDVRMWMEDFVYSKTYDGLMVQKAVIKKIAEDENLGWRLANADEEKQGVDGFINEKAVQIKSETYKETGKKHNEEVTCPVVYYRKLRNTKDISFDYDPKWFK